MCFNCGENLDDFLMKVEEDTIWVKKMYDTYLQAGDIACYTFELEKLWVYSVICRYFEKYKYSIC